MWTWTLLRAGTLHLDGGGMFGVVPKTMWSKMIPPDEDNRITLNTNCLLLSDGRRTVLVETGFGDKWSEKERGFWDLQRRSVLDALREAGTPPEAIDLVIVTHLHFDHAAALTRFGPGGPEAPPVPTFPNARIVSQRTEWADALANKSTMTRTYLRSHLDPVAGATWLVDGEAEILPGLSVFPAPGHTWGQQAVKLDDGRGIVVFPGDVMPTVHHAGPAFSMGFDVMPYQSKVTKLALLDRAVRDRWRLVLDHEPGHAVVRPERDPQRPDRFTLHPA